jgi:hypothetical protein
VDLSRTGLKFFEPDKVCLRAVKSASFCVGAALLVNGANSATVSKMARNEILPSYSYRVKPELHDSLTGRTPFGPPLQRGRYDARSPLVGLPLRPGSR